MMIHVPERFAGQFAGGVRRDGAEDRIRLAERHTGVHAINRGRGRDGDFLNTVLSGGLEQVSRTLYIHALVQGRLL